MSALYTTPPFKKNKEDNLEFNPISAWEAEYILDITKKTIDFLQNRLRLETQTLTTIPNEQSIRDSELRIDLEMIERRLNWNLLKIDAIKMWYVLEKIPYPGTPEYIKQRKDMDEILEQVRQHARKELKLGSSEISDYEKIKSIVLRARKADETDARKYQKMIQSISPKKQSRSAYLSRIKDEIESAGEEFAKGAMIWYDNQEFQERRGRPTSN